MADLQPVQGIIPVIIRMCSVGILKYNVISPTGIPYYFGRLLLGSIVHFVFSLFLILVALFSNSIQYFITTFVESHSDLIFSLLTDAVLTKKAIRIKIYALH